MLGIEQHCKGMDRCNGNLVLLQSDMSAVVSLLNSARKEMYDSHSLFLTHVKHITTLMLTIMAAVLAIISFVIKESQSIQQFQGPSLMLAASLLGALFPLSILSVQIIGRHYRLYVSALLYAAELHYLFAGKCHPWFAKIDAKIFCNDELKVEYVNNRTWGRTHSLFYYSAFLICLGILSAGIAVVLFIDALNYS